MSAARAPRSQQRHSADTQTDTPLLEWVIGAMGLALLAAAIVFLAIEGLQQESRGGVRVMPELTQKVENGYLVHVAVRNLGKQTLADLHISARLLSDEQEIDSAELVIDYLPGQASRKAGVYLRHDPSRYRLELRAEGFQEP